METVSYEDFARGISHRIAGKRVPLRGTIEVTRRCPLSCAHCYNNLPIEDEEARRTELSYEEHCRIVDEIVEAGCFWLLYTGGEIFARSDFIDIYKYAKRQGLLITLFTNAVLINEKIVDSLADYPPHYIEITLYGHTTKTYETITGKPGSFERCMRGIRLLMERGIPLKLKTVTMTLNKHEISEMKRFVEEDLGLEFRYDAMINPRLDRSRGPLALAFVFGALALSCANHNAVEEATVLRPAIITAEQWGSTPQPIPEERRHEDRCRNERPAGHGSDPVAAPA